MTCPQFLLLKELSCASLSILQKSKLRPRDGEYCLRKHSKARTGVNSLERFWGSSTCRGPSHLCLQLLGLTK